MPRARTAPAPAALMTATILALAAALPLRAAQTPSPTGGEGRPTDGTLREIEERGRAIAAYLRAIDRARQVFASQGQGMADPDAIAALEDHDIWHLFYLKDTSKGTQPGAPRAETMVLAQADYSPGSDEIGSLRVMIPPHAAPATPISFARAVQVAEAAARDRRVAEPPLDTAVIRERDGTFSLYLRSRPSDESKVTFGGDFVARVAASGRQLLSLDPLHPESTAVSVAGHPAGRPTVHLHKTDDLPSPTDVAQVLRYTAVAPHLVLTRRSIFRIDSQGVVTYLGPNQLPGEAAPGAETPGVPAPRATPPAGGGGRP